MQKPKRLTTPFNFSQFMVTDLYEKFPQFFQLGELEFCSCIYYPIAQLELEILENSSEEFDSIEYTILEMIDAGVYEPTNIAKMLGISASYVTKIMRILEGYGHLDGTKLTTLGKKSIQDEVKYTEFLVKQAFQADPIFGDFIKKEMIQPKAYLTSAEDTIPFIPHVEPDPYVEEELLNHLLRDLKPYQKGKNRLFHVNAKKIKQVVDKKVRFAYAFLLKFERMEEPIVVMRCKEEAYTEKAVDAFYWKPVAIPSTASHYFSTMEEADQIYSVSPERFQGLIRLQADILKQLQFITEKRQAFPKNVEIFFTSDWRVDKDNISYTVSENIVRLTIDLADVIEFDKKWLQSLLYYDVGLIKLPYVRFAGNHRYPGFVCYASTTNETYEQFIKDVQQAILYNREDLDEYYERNESKIRQLKEEASVKEVGLLNE